MGIANWIKEKRNPKLIEQFDDFIAHNKTLFERWQKGINSSWGFREIGFENEPAFRQIVHEYQIEDNYGHIPHYKKPDKFTFEEKKYVVEHIPFIISINKAYGEYSNTLYNFSDLFRKYPKGVNYVCIKYLDIEVFDLASETISTIGSVLFNKEKQQTLGKSSLDYKIPVPDSLLNIKRPAKQRLSDDKLTHTQRLAVLQHIDEIKKEDEHINSLIEENKLLVKAYEEWLDEQKDFCVFVREERNQSLPSWGCYYYYIDVKSPSYIKNEKTDSYQVWQFFLGGFCLEEDLDYTNCPQQLKSRNDLRNLRNHSIYVKEYIYNNIFTFILKIREKYGKVSVIWGDSGERYCKDLNEYHFQSISNLLSQAGICSYTLEDDCKDLLQALSLSNKSNNPNEFKYFIFIELISSNENLKKQCKLLMNMLNKWGMFPHIAFISLKKGYDREEMQKLINEKNAEIEEKRQKEIEIKFENEVLKKVERKSYYIGFCKERNINERHQKEYILQHLQDLDCFIPIAKRNEAQRLIKMTCDAGWEARFGGSIRTFSLYNYYPTTCEWEADEDDWSVRYLVWNFKNSKEKADSWRPSRNMFDNPHIKYIGAINTIIPLIEKVLVKTFGDDLSMLTLACIPASTKINTSRRYARFSERLCAETNMTNGYDYIQILREGGAKHLGGNSSMMVDCDKDFFKGKFVILFDDVITKGNSMMRFKRELEDCGAYIIGGMSIGRTKHEKVDIHPIDELEQKNSIDIEDDLPF